MLAYTTTKDWGGVNKVWWNKNTIAKYGWDVDPESVWLMDGTRNRYHVLLQKNAV